MNTTHIECFDEVKLLQMVLKFKNEIMAEQEKPKVENANQALVVLIQGVQAAQAKGAYSFQDSTLIGQAIAFFKTKPEGEDQGPAGQPIENGGKIEEDSEITE